MSAEAAWLARQEAEAEAEQGMRRAFAAFDIDESGFVTQDQLSAILTRPVAGGNCFTVEEAEALFGKADLNGDGMVDYDEFSKAWAGGLLRLGAAAPAFAPSTPMRVHLSAASTDSRMYRRRAMIDAPSAKGCTALLLAAEEGDAQIVAALLKKGSSMALIDAEGNSALMQACRMGHALCAELLLEAGAEVGQARSDGATPRP